MRVFLKKTLVFLILPLILYVPFCYFILPDLLEYTNGPNTKSQINFGFNEIQKNEYDLLCLGNSRIYRCVNPEFFESSSFNFGHDDDTFNQIYYKLIYADSKGKHYKYLLLGVDYFQFSFLPNSRNHIYKEFFDKSYLDDYPQKSKSKINEYKSKFSFLKFSLITSINLFRESSYLKKNGQYVRFENYNPYETRKRDINRLEIQVEYFNKILNYCESKNIVVYMVMPPLKDLEYTQYEKDKIQEFDTFLENYKSDKVHYFNFSQDTSFSDYDFFDFTHLNLEASDIFSRKINDSIKKVNQ